MAKALQHSKDTALRYYQVPDAREALRRQRHIDVIDETVAFEDSLLNEFDSLFPPVPYASWNEDGIRERLLDSDAYAAHPMANLTDALIQRIKARFNDEVFEQRAEILERHLHQEYNRDNITKYAVIDVSKRHKLHYFPASDQDKMCHKVISMLK
ncbi:unnamed protein product [Macrosiphum euphorbiae]|uniref:Uncharacterized protein n=1 Tax=Macrosiphum euphorbiae TaxID=13131 RepID=A0AAV0WLL3_9HEMI|nr:unnamed protein product [Macrosiphum euphorbiae]